MKEQIEGMEKEILKVITQKGNLRHVTIYRKQKEGEWKQAYNNYPRYVCTNCNHLYNNKEYKYCPNCGAHMKGGAE